MTFLSRAFLLVVCLHAANSAHATNGHLTCFWGADQYWDDSISRVSVRLNWTTFNQKAQIPFNRIEAYERAVTYAINQWNAYGGVSPWYFYGGVAEITVPGYAEVIVYMKDCNNANPPYDNSVHARATPVDPNCFFGDGQYTRAYIEFYARDVLSDGTCGQVRSFNLGDLSDQSSTHFTPILIHELGHTFGLLHTCNCPDSCGYPAACDWGTFMGQQTMKNGMLSAVDEKFKENHGPWSWDVAEKRRIQNTYTHQIAHYASSNAGSTWSSQGTSLLGQTSNAPVGVLGGTSNGEYMVAWQGTGSTNTLNVIKGNGVTFWINTKQTFTQNSQLGVSLAGDTNPSSQRAVMAFNFGSSLGSSDAMNRWVDLLYTSNGGQTWTYQPTSMRSVARPGIAYSAYSDKWVLAYQSRDQRKIHVHVMNDAFPLNYGDNNVLSNNGNNIAGFGAVQVACSSTQNTCRIVFTSDGTGDQTETDAFNVRVVRGQLIGNSFVITNADELVGIYGLSPMITENSTHYNVRYNLGWLDYELFEKFYGIYTNWSTTRNVNYSYTDSVGAMAFSPAYYSPYGETVMYFLKY